MLGAGAPTDLAQFAEENSFTVDTDSAESTVSGYGAPDGDGIRFHEKDVDTGKDVRIWHIIRGSDGTFTAEPGTAY